MSVDCMPEVVRTRRQYPAAPPERVSKNAYLGDFLLIDELKKEKKRRSGNCEENRIFSVECGVIYFGIDVCFWPLDNNFIQKLPL